MTISDLDSRSGSCGRSTDAVVVDTRESCRGLQRAHADQVVCRSGEEKLPVHAGASTVTEFAQPADGFHPAEDFLDALPSHLTDRIPRMSSRAAIERATVPLHGVMWRRVERAGCLHETACVVSFVPAARAPSVRRPGDQTRPGVRFARARR